MLLRGLMPRMIVFVPILVGACSVGTYGETMQGTDGSMMGGDDRDVCADRAATPPIAYDHVSAPTGPRSGMGCVVAGCHLTGNTGANAPPFSFAGTVYKDIAGTTPQPGVVVRLFPTTGNTKKSVAVTITDAAGNFSVNDPALTAFPYNTDVTACGTDSVAKGIRPMVGGILRQEMNCNAGNTCHQAAPTKTATPVYLLD